MVGRLSPLAVVLLACGTSGVPSGGMTVTEARAPAPADTAVAAVYLTLVNGGPADTLVGITSAIARRAGVHVSERDAGVRRMRLLAEMAIPAGTTLRMAPGGMHVMLEELTRVLLPSDTLVLTLTFRRAGVVRVSVPVVRYEDLAP